jgi:hypothetical protein
MSLVAYELKTALTAKRPMRWDIQVRYALRQPDQSLTLPAGTWLLSLPEPEETGQNGRSHPSLYRLADGSLVCLPAPLTETQAAPLADPQAVTALTAYRSLEEFMWEAWGLGFEPVDHTPPFRLIQCPLCGGAAFTTVAFASVWCNGCNANFNVRYTAGDPGFVVDCTWPHLSYRESIYLIPRSEDLLLTMVFKNSGDPLDLSHDKHCHRQDCTPAQTALTDGQDGTLRPGLHACALGDVYHWSFYGGVPTGYHPDRHGYHTLYWPAASDKDGHRQETWPSTAFIPVTGLDAEDKRQLDNAAALLKHEATNGRYRDDLISALTRLSARPSRTPATYRSPWPKRKHLRDGEKYLLHRWLVSQEKDSLPTAVPVWLVVKELSEARGSFGWQVVRDDICPHCGQPVTAADLAHQVELKRPWTIPHGHCRDLWQRHTWQPTLLAAESELASAD